MTAPTKLIICWVNQGRLHGWVHINSMYELGAHWELRLMCPVRIVLGLCTRTVMYSIWYGYGTAPYCNVLFSQKIFYSRKCTAHNHIQK